MAIQFNHKPKGSVIGSGSYVFRHFGVELATYTITATATNVTASASNPNTIIQGGTAVLTFTADGSSYKVPTTMPTITGATGTYNRVSDTQCTITLSNPTGNVSFSVVGEVARVTNLTGTTWQFNEIIADYPVRGARLHISGSCYSGNDSVTSTSTYNCIGFYDGSANDYGLWLFMDSASGYPNYYFLWHSWYSGQPWVYAYPSYNFRVVSAPILQITGGNDATNQTLINWMYSNATRV